MQHKGLIKDARQQARVFTELSAMLDKPAPLQTQCLSVPVFACLLCHEMDRGRMIVPVEQCKYAPRGEDLGRPVECCGVNWAQHCMLHSEGPVCPFGRAPVFCFGGTGEGNVF